MTDTIEHRCTVSWGMLYSPEEGGAQKYIDSIIEEKKKAVTKALHKIGYKVKDQHFIQDCEWGTLVTWAEAVKEGSITIQGDTTIKPGGFYLE